MIIGNRDNIFVDVSVCENGAGVRCGNALDFEIMPCPLFKAELKGATGEKRQITSIDNWDSVKVKEENGQCEISFYGYEGISVILNARAEKDSIVWRARIENTSGHWSVMGVCYPSPVLKKAEYDLFIPRFGGRTLKGASKKEYNYKNDYPGTITMQYFSAYSGGRGVYLGVEDENATVKNFNVSIENTELTLNAYHYAPGATMAKNSFELSGEMRWQTFLGDWYDAAKIYADFVYKKAKWLPKAQRPDTAQRFKKIPFWISDYIPNIQSQGNNKPMLLSAGSDIYEPDYWYRTPIELKHALGDLPVGYHVYNWHKIPFNIEYPHFLPAKETFVENAPKLRENGIYVVPYINAVSWESRDGEMGHEISFDNTGRTGAVVQENGEIFYAQYPQMTKSGHGSHLVPMCPSFEKWHEIIGDVSIKMESNLPIDGIYFDEIAAHPARVCYNPSHNHLPGGGSYWVDGDNCMMEKIARSKPREFYYLTESCAEPFMKSFDGYLTWNWVYPEDVPAFASIYAGYIQMVGRVTDGKKKGDLLFFKYCTAKSLVYGQQLGWCKADVLWREKWISFLKNAVKVRYSQTDVFNCGKMLRPPMVKTSHAVLATEAGLDNKGNIETQAVVAGAWSHCGKTVIIAANIAEESVDFTLTFDINEYGLENKALPKEFCQNGGQCVVNSTLNVDEIKTWTI